MKHRKYTMCIVILSLLFWLVDSVIHRFIYLEETFELIPSDLNELWMRVLIIVTLIIIGLLADNRAEKVASVEREKREVFMATVSSAQHILNNLLNQMQLVFFELNKDDGLNDEIRKLLDQSIREGKEQIDRLSVVTKLNEKTIRESVGPD